MRQSHKKVIKVKWKLLSFFKAHFKVKWGCGYVMTAFFYVVYEKNKLVFFLKQTREYSNP